jgi:hypothetical protein
MYLLGISMYPFENCLFRAIALNLSYLVFAVELREFLMYEIRKITYQLHSLQIFSPIL